MRTIAMHICFRTVTDQRMGKKEGGAKSVVDKVVEVIRVQKSLGGSSM